MKEYPKATTIEEFEKLIELMKEDLENQEKVIETNNKTIQDLQTKASENFNLILSLQNKNNLNDEDEEVKNLNVEDLKY